MYWLVYRKRNSFLWTLSLLKHFKCWWNFCSRIVSQRCLAGQQCSFQKLCFNLECMKSGNWSKRSYDVLQTHRNHFAKNIIWCHNSSEWVKDFTIVFIMLKYSGTLFETNFLKTKVCLRNLIRIFLLHFLCIFVLVGPISFVKK